MKLLIKTLDAIVAAGSASLECSVLERSAGTNSIRLCGLLALAAHTTKISTSLGPIPVSSGNEGCCHEWRLELSYLQMESTVFLVKRINA